MAKPFCVYSITMSMKELHRTGGCNDDSCPSIRDALPHVFPKRGTTLYTISAKMNNVYRNLLLAESTDDVDKFVDHENAFYDLQDKAREDPGYDELVSELNERTATQRIREAEQLIRGKNATFFASLAQMSLRVPTIELRDSFLWTSMKTNDSALRSICLARRANFVVHGIKCSHCEHGAGPYKQCSIVLMANGEVHPASLERCVNCMHSMKSNCNMLRLPEVRQWAADLRKESLNKTLVANASKASITSSSIDTTETTSKDTADVDATRAKSASAKTNTGQAATKTCLGKRRNGDASNKREKINGRSQMQTRLRLQVDKNLDKLKDIYQRMDAEQFDLSLDA